VEVFDDQPPSLRLTVADLERQVTDGAAEFKTRCFQQKAVAVQYCKEPLDRILLPERGFQDSRLEHRSIFFEYGDQEIFLARKEVIQASAVCACRLQDLHDTLRRVSLPEEEIPRSLHDPLSCNRVCCHCFVDP